MRRWKLLLVVWIVATMPVWLPALSLAAIGHPDRYEYYLKGLEYGLSGLKEYFYFIEELFKIAIST